jgi:hypothetical protein
MHARVEFAAAFLADQTLCNVEQNRVATVAICKRAELRRVDVDVPAGSRGNRPADPFRNATRRSYL